MTPVRIKPRPLSCWTTVCPFLIAVGTMLVVAYLQRDTDESDRIIAQCGQPTRLMKVAQNK